MAKTYRVQLDFSHRAFDELGKLKEKMKISSNAEVVSHALGLLQFAVNLIEEGWTLQKERNGETVEIKLHHQRDDKNVTEADRAFFKDLGIAFDEPEEE